MNFRSHTEGTWRGSQNYRGKNKIKVKSNRQVPLRTFGPITKSNG